MGENDLEDLENLEIHIYILNSRVRLSRGTAKDPQVGPKGCRETAWQCISTEPSNVLLVKWRPVDGEVSINTYPGERLSQISALEPIDGRYRRAVNGPTWCWCRLQLLLAHCFIKVMNVKFTPRSKLTLNCVFCEYWVCLRDKKRNQLISGPIYTN